MTFTPPPAGWDTFGTNLDFTGQLEFSTETDDAGDPLWERRIPGTGTDRAPRPPADGAVDFPGTAPKRSADYIRVVADVTYRGEWFIPTGGSIHTPNQAEDYVRSNTRFEGPENLLIDHRAIVHPDMTFVTDGDGERLTEYDDEIAARPFAWAVEVESLDGVYTPIISTNSREHAEERAALLNQLLCPALDEGEQPFARVAPHGGTA